MIEVRRFFIALGYFTRIPIPAWVGWAPDELNRAARYFPAVGLLIGTISAAVLWAASLIWQPPLAILLAMLTSLLLTGAFHEDGLADSADGFGGGYTPARVLEIMKDSRIGTFGGAALVMALLAKFAALWVLGPQAVLALVIAHPVSRAAALCLMHALPYVREDDSARAKPLAHGLRRSELAIGITFAAASLLLALMWHGISPMHAGLCVVFAGLTAIGCARYFMRRIGGYTGDCLGATQQLCELAIYFALATQI